MPDIEKAVQFAESIANDNTHGYSQARRDGGIDTDCSKLVITALRSAGFDTGSASYTGDMLAPILAAGFSDVAGSVNLRTGAGLMRGDILLRPKAASKNGHTAFYIGDGKIVQAQSDYDGKLGDSSGREIRIQNYYDSPFTHVLRYSSAESSDGTAVGKITNCLYYCNRRERPTTNSPIVGKAELGQECRFNGKHRTNGEIWLHDTIGNWISASFVAGNFDNLPWM